jgi:hypothetical protein
LPNLGFIFFLFFLLALGGLLLFIPLRWIAMRSVISEKDPPKQFDPKRTPLSGVEILALVLPLCFIVSAVVLFSVIYALAMSKNIARTEWFGWFYLAFMIAGVGVAGKIGASVSNWLLRRSNSVLAEQTRDE